MHTLPLVIVSVLALTPLVASRDICSTTASRWDYWWYGNGPLYRCAEHNVCHISHIDQKTIGWSVTTGGSLSFDLAKSAAVSFGSTYTWSESTTTGDTYTADYYPPETERLWIKQWFAVMDMNCQKCDWICTPIGMAEGGDGNATTLEERGQHCEQACDDKRHVVAWVPCKDASCVEYQFSDAYAQCDNSNHCQQN